MRTFAPVASDVYLEQIEAADLGGFRDTAAFFVTAFWDDYKAEVALQVCSCPSLTFHHSISVLHECVIRLTLIRLLWS